MITVYARRLLPLSLLAVTSAILLVVGMACGGAGEPESDSGGSAATTGTTQSSSGSAPAATQVPAAAPAATEAPAMEAMDSDVDLFTVMVTTQGNELFNSKYGQGENNLWQRLGQVWLVGGSLTDGSLVLDPATGIANKWEIVDDGLAWEFTIRPGIQFHNGEELDVNDVDFMANWSITDEIGQRVSTVCIAREITNREVTGPDTFKYTFKGPPSFFGAAVSEVDNTAIGTVLSVDYWNSLPLGANLSRTARRYGRVSAGGSPLRRTPILACPDRSEVVGYHYEEEILYKRYEDYFLLPGAALSLSATFRCASGRSCPPEWPRFAGWRGCHHRGRQHRGRARSRTPAGASSMPPNRRTSGSTKTAVQPGDRQRRPAHNVPRPTGASGPGLRHQQDHRSKLSTAAPTRFQIDGMHGIGSPVRPGLRALPWPPAL